MQNILANKLSLIKPSPTLAVTAKAAALKAQGKDIIGLGAGEPDFDTPKNIKEAAIKAIEHGKTKYTTVDGITELKQAICNKFKRDNQLDYNPNQITVGTGAKQVLFNVLFATINPQDEVIIPCPYWVSYPDIVNIAQGTPVYINTLAINDFKITPELLEQAITPKTKWLILNSPSNPTGAAYSKIELQALAEVLLAHPQVYILSDDIYEHIIFDDFKFYTLAQIEPKLQERVFTLNGVSKTYAMTGWRIGYGAGAEFLIKAIAIIQSQSTSNPCSISQYAALEALQGIQNFMQPNIELFQKRRNLVVDLLNNIPGITCKKPNGAFYIFPSCEAFIGKHTPSGKIINNCTDFTEYLLEEGLVAVVQGLAFGMENFFRISYATSDKLLVEACKRIAHACKKLS